MALAKRIIPVILHKNGQLVKGQNFVNDRVVGHALQAARVHAMRGVDELMILDVSATQEKREPNYKLIQSLAEHNFSPLTVGGGVHNEHHIRGLLNSGADKICIKSAYINSLISGSKFLERMSGRYGRSTITVAVDVEVDTSSAIFMENIIWECQQIEKRGAGELLLQSINRDGTMKGYDLALIREVSAAVSIPVIASGGCGSYDDMYQGLLAGADALAVGAFFQFESATPKGAAEYLDSRGIEVRI